MRTILFLMVLMTVAGGVFSQTGAYPDSAAMEQLFDNYFRDFIKLNPEDAAALGLPPEWGYQYDHGALNDWSEAGIKANFDLSRKYLADLEKIGLTGIAPSQQTDAKILAWFLKTGIEGERFLYHKYFLDFLFGVHSLVANLLTEYHTISNRGDAEDYLSRLRKIPTRVNQAIELIKNQDKRGLRPPVFLADRFIAGLEDFRNTAPAENLFVTDLKNKLTQIEPNDSTDIAKFAGQAESIVKEKIYPAYDNLIAASREMAQKADSAAGLWHLPDGDKYYEYCLKFHTASTSSAEEVFNRGLEEVATIQGKARLILDSLGFKGDKNFGELMNDYRASCRLPENKDKYYFPDGPEKRQMILDDYNAVIDFAYSRLPEIFKYIPKTKVAVKPVPEYKEQSGLTYYEAASLDGKREATFYINMLTPMMKPNTWSLTFHETIPGHHFQIATQQELTSGRIFKSLIFLPGFGEGWAMYVEEMAGEQGWYPDQDTRLIELNSQLFRAVRIVLDAGIHYKKWTREQALNYMQENMGWQSINEVDRYCVWPGQACSYTLGKLKIMDLREKAKKELGDKFKLADFHTEVLKNGSLPLDLLEEVIDDYIKRNKS